MHRDYRITSLTWTPRKLEVTAFSVLLNFPINLTRQHKFSVCRPVICLPSGVQARGVLQQKEMKPPPTKLFFFPLPWVSIATICQWLAERKWRHFLNQSEVIWKQLVTCLHVFPVRNARDMYFIIFLIGSLDCRWHLWLGKVLSLNLV